MIMTKEQFAALRKEMEDALSFIADKYNCEVKVGKIAYDEITTEIKLTLNSKGENGKSAEQLQFEKYCRNYGFEPEDYGMTLTEKGKTYAFIGFNPNARKNYCLLRSEGKTYTCAIDFVVAHKEGR